MKTSSLFGMLATILMFGLYACSSEANSDTTTIGPSPVGEWRFTGYSDDARRPKFTDCDARTVWRFSNEAAPHLADGTKVKHMTATAPDECEHFGFEATWTMLPDNMLFLSTTRMGGVGGASFAGRFKVKELTEERMVLEVFKSTYTFER